MTPKPWPIRIMGPNPAPYVTLARCPFCDVRLPWDDLEAQAEHLASVHPDEPVPAS
jgi:hypothetical protein